MIDLFAGPGGLGEGFSSVLSAGGQRAFRIALSVEMDAAAHRTLELRAFYRQFDDVRRPDAYYEYLLSPKPEAREALFEAFPEEARAARAEAWHHRLSPETAAQVTARAKKAIGRRRTWVLIGGPPCQAYSLAGRSRRANDDSFASDLKHTLYEHYLRLIEDLEPPVFVMENVKGILSAKLGGCSTIDKVLSDLRDAGPGYDIYSFATSIDDPLRLRPAGFVIKSEQYGVPQARHRVILLGIRSGLRRRPRTLEQSERPIPASSVLSDLPPLRSRISRRAADSPDDPVAWFTALEAALPLIDGADALTRARAERSVEAARRSPADASYPPQSCPAGRRSMAHPDWYGRDLRAPFPLNHESRSHMVSDLARYLFCASFADVWGFSPKLNQFPEALLPAHANVAAGVAGTSFADRFRVQTAGAPSTTITSHISKDGHYYIHYDPTQCRSLSVREAARLQTFPDDYFFEGNRTQQYHQVGNAVPPLLAYRIAGVVADLLAVRGVPTAP